LSPTEIADRELAGYLTIATHHQDGSSGGDALRSVEVVNACWKGRNASVSQGLKNPDFGREARQLDKTLRTMRRSVASWSQRHVEEVCVPTIQLPQVALLLAHVALFGGAALYSPVPCLPSLSRSDGAW